MSDLFRQGVEALKLEDKEKARKLLAQAVKEDPKNKNAWLWLSQAVEEERQQIACFRKVLEIDPQNEYARKGLRHIQRKRQKALDKSKANLSQSPSSNQETLAKNLSPNLLEGNGESAISKPKKTIPLWVLVAVSIGVMAFCGWIMILSTIGENNFSSEPRTISTQNGTFSIPGNGFIDGRDVEAVPALTIMEVRVWDGVGSGRRAVCKIAHGTAVQILDVKQDPDVSGQWYHFQVQSGSCKGWVTWWFVNTQKFEPVGDRIYDN